MAVNVYGSWPNHGLALGQEKDAPLRDQFFEGCEVIAKLGDLQSQTAAA
jgi:hypothetical protein